MIKFYLTISNNENHFPELSLVIEQIEHFLEFILSFRENELNILSSF